MERRRFTPEEIERRSVNAEAAYEQFFVFRDMVLSDLKPYRHLLTGEEYLRAIDEYYIFYSERAENNVPEWVTRRAN